MKHFHNGAPIRESLPKSPPFSSCHTAPTCTTMVGVGLSFSPPNGMRSTRSNLTRSELTLDEQSFQGLLAAAFTIQEHNDQVKKALHTPAPSEASPEPEPNIVCPHCGAPKLTEESRCQNCSLDQFRPGERLQHNWASMWLKSQEQGLWPERPAEVGQDRQKPRAGTPGAGTPRADTPGESVRRTVPPLAGERRPFAPSARASASNRLVAWPVAEETVKEKTAEAETERKTQAVRDPAIGSSSLDESALNQFEAQNEWTPETFRDLTREDLAPEGSDPSVPPLQFSASDDSFPSDSFPSDAFPSDSDDAPNSWRFANLRVKLRFHRADVYLGAAIFLALVALMWPAVSAPRRAALGPMERALVALGIAEAPAPAAAHPKGDPGISVWIDPHTALYYCPGEEQYGKTADGRFSSQRDAQMDRFQPASRSACE